MNPTQLLDEVLSALLGQTSQNQRLLRLQTPLGADVLLAERLHGRETITPGTDTAAGLHFTVHALSTNAHLDFKALIGQPALLELELADASLRPWHGHITAVALEGSDGGLARYRLDIEPWLAFLGHRQDSWVFQDMSVPQIIDEVFADYAGQGTLAPAWRWALADTSVYPRRSLCIQYQETDLAFVLRLLREEGLFAWFEHQGAPDDPTLGQHTLVLADHNAALALNAQPRVRYTQSSASLNEDSLLRWQRGTRVQAARLALASPDYRSGPQDSSLRAVSAAGTRAPVAHLAITDVPGQYAYEDTTQGDRLARRQMEALDAQREQHQGTGPWRSAAPGTCFTLLDHAVHDGQDEARDHFAVLAVVHQARNNLRADVQAGLDSLLGSIRRSQQDPASVRTLANASEEPIFTCTLTAQRAAVPVRPGGFSSAEASGLRAGWAQPLPDPRLTPRPSIHGVQTALVVGLDAPVQTDRDHRVQVQFHWQRGAQSSHRLAHSAGCNAPASNASGTWVRVAEPIAGANWGSVFVPRLGQEVLVGFVGGDIDRPVVLGAVYNGQGTPDGQGNQQAAGAGRATGNAPAWFVGNAAEGALQAHQHPAVLSGHKSQALASSQSGVGGFNQLVMDDSPGAGRIELASSTAQTRLQLGHLLHQVDNRRLQPRGHGLDLATQAWGAVRAGSGLLLSAHGIAPSTSSTQQMDSRAPRAQLQQATTLAHTLAESAQQHNAKLPGETNTVGATAADTAKQLPFEQGLHATQQSLAGTLQHGGDEGGTDGSDDAATAIGGGTGTAATLARPDLVLAAPAGISSQTPAHTLASAGHTASWVAGQDLHHLAQGHIATAAKAGLVFFTYGKASNPNKPNTETGIQLHTATGNLNTQSQSGATHLAADQAISVASTTGMVKITAPQHILLTAGGAGIRIEGGNITLTAPGKVELKAAMKELGGGKSASQGLSLTKPGQIFDEQFVVKDQASGNAMAYFKYRVESADGQVLARGITGADGRTSRIFTDGAKALRILADD